MDNGLSIRLNRETGFKVFKPQVVVLGAFESFSFARRRGRMGFVIRGLAGCCCMRHSSSLVSCSSSWRSAIGLLLYSSVMKRCHIEYSISSSYHRRHRPSVCPCPNLPFRHGEFLQGESELVLSSLSAPLCVMKNVRHVLKDSSSIWVLIRRRPCRRHPRSCLGYCDHRALRYVPRHRLNQSRFQRNRCLRFFGHVEGRL